MTLSVPYDHQIQESQKASTPNVYLMRGNIFASVLQVATSLIKMIVYEINKHVS